METENIINLNKHRFKKYTDKNRNLREFQDRYEYCLIKRYEEQFEDFQCHSIYLKNIFVQLIITREKPLLVSYEFSKERYNIENIIQWLDRYKVLLIPNKDVDFIEGGYRIIEAIKFEGWPIILYEKGNDILYFDVQSLNEITESYISNEQYIDTSKSLELDKF